jgi:L-fuconolactonase
VTVDAHFHVWDPATRRHEWLEGSRRAIHRRFDLDDLAAVAGPFGVDTTVLVQVLADLDETEEFLAIAAGSPFVAGVVGWVDLTGPDVGVTLARLREMPGGAKLVGIRHLVESEPDPAWLEREDVTAGLREVAAQGLTFDLLLKPHQLRAAIRAADAVPELPMVVDHGAKPLIEEGEWEPWSSELAMLAERQHVHCKLSGLVTEAGPNWTRQQVVPFGRRFLELFTPARLIYGGDWPVCTLVATYAEVFETALECLDGLGQDEREAVLARNAIAFYKLAIPPAAASAAGGPAS